ncbi:YtzH-like family protein [Bacillus sp. 165]|uniref:YtzH-like family protein n=1 Tax=Bacillus sp. 165 TaxID=1529117 RepID=UPI001AD989CE|nr:YtzH-like family protein [Bacillus sp. 165]MBO9130877.1 YtzH-like family protein [Bacillus sp. 165]
MPLNHEHQMEILKDILTNHQTDCCGTVSEYEQLERLIKSLMTNDNVNNEMKNMLPDMYSYSQSGKNASDLDQHITSHQDELSNWLGGMDSFS